MAITRPLIFTSVEDAEALRPNAVNEETVRKMVQNINLLGALAALASVRFIHLNLSGVVSPNANIWQEADGSKITNPFSPLTSIVPNEYFTPNIINKYPRGASDASTNTAGGSYTVDASHDHATTDVGHALVGQEGDERSGYLEPSHNHVIAVAPIIEPLEVSHQELGVYLKIG